jgi:threonine dehydrogenase-like Zn-dependent dehydrogenase
VRPRQDSWFTAAAPTAPLPIRRPTSAVVARRRFSYAPLVTHRFGLDQVDEAYELMDARADGSVKAVLTP